MLFRSVSQSRYVAISVDWALTDTIEEFGVTFAYDWWEVSGGTTGNAGGN